jgi:hypothetical protein
MFPDYREPPAIFSHCFKKEGVIGDHCLEGCSHYARGSILQATFAKNYSDKRAPTQSKPAESNVREKFTPNVKVCFVNERMISSPGGGFPVDKYSSTLVERMAL